MDQLKILIYEVQKGFKATMGFVGLQLADFDVNATTHQGIIVPEIAAHLRCSFAPLYTLPSL